ncbi:MAG TPA: hypothetical protein VMR50_06665 [Myxococcota bacterium]|nr:hypothetical protein [Myxococcota bacterium]
MLSGAKKIFVGRAIAVGMLFVNGPVFLLLIGPAAAVLYLQSQGVLPKPDNTTPFIAMGVGFVLAWLWWSISVPKWRLWAYQRVDDVSELKRSAVQSGLTWPDGSIFARTEIKTKAHAARERALDPTRRDS